MAKESEWETIVPAPRPTTRPAPARDAQGWETIVPAPAPAIASAKDEQGWETIVPAKAPAKPPVIPVARDDTEAFPLLREAADLPLKTGVGAVSGIRAVADWFGADNAVSKNLRGVEDYVAALYSAQSKRDSKEMARIMKEVEDKGIWDNVGAAVRAAQVAPLDLLANALGTAAPAILAGVATIFTGGTPLVGAAITLGTGAVMGGGTVKGAIYDATKEVLSQQTKMTPEQIEKAAVEAQRTDGKNLDQILLGMGLGAFGASTGGETILARQLAKGIATTVAQKEAVKAVTEKAVAEAAKRGVVKNAVVTAGKDFLGEGAQGGQERLAANLALQRQGFAVPTMRGVVGQGTLEGLAGAGMGTITGGREAFTAKNEVALQNAANLTSQEQEELRDRFTTSGMDTKAADRAPTQQELDMLNTTTAAPPGSVIPPTPASPVAQELKAFIDTIPEGKETEMISTKDVKTLIAKMKELGLPAPKADKTKGESTRVLAVQALRQYFAAGGEQLTDIPDLQGTTDGTQAAQTQQTTPQGQQTTPAPDVTTATVTPPPAPPVDVTPPTPAAPVAIPMNKGVDAVYKGALARFTANPKDAKALATVNSLERTHNMPLTGVTPQGGVLSAKSKKVAPVVEEESSVAYKYDSTLSPEFNQEIANLIATENERVDQEKLTANLAETDAKKAGKFETSKEDRDAFEKVRAEHNADAAQRNQKRADALAAVKAANDKVDAALSAEAEYKKSAGITEDVEPTDYATTKTLKGLKGDKVKLTELANAVNDAIAEEEAADAYLMTLDPEDVLYIPAWSDMGALKDIYFSDIKYGAIPEHRKAAQAVVQALTDRSYKGLSEDEKRVVNAYNDTRTRVSKMFSTTFPKWRDLSDKAKEVFKEGLTNFSGLQLDRSFGNLAKYLKTEAATKVEQSKTQIGQENKDRLERIQRESDERKNRIPAGWNVEIDPLTGRAIPPRFGSNLEKSRLTTQRDTERLRGIIGSSDSRTNLYDALIFISKMKSVSRFNKVIAGAIASMVKRMKSPPRLKLVTKLSNDDHGQYDPSFVTPGKEHIGEISIKTVSPTILLHEAIHAVTVEVLNKYLNNDSSLTSSQVAGAKQLLNIMAVTRDYVDETGKKFSEKYPNAYTVTEDGRPNKESVFEFIAYALTDNEFQKELSNINLPAESRLNYVMFAKGDTSPAETASISNISNKPRSAWTEFKLSVAKLITAGVQRVKEVLSKEEQKETQDRLEEEFKKQGKYVPVDREAVEQEDIYELQAIPLADLLSEAGTPGSFANQNFLMEIAAAFEDIMAPQTGAIVLDSEESLSARSTPAPTPRTAQELRSGGINDTKLRDAMKEQGLPEGGQKTGVFKPLLTQDGWRNMAKLVQDRTYEARSYFRRQDLGGKIVRDMTKAFNNVTEHLDLSMGEMRNYLDNYLRTPLEEYKTAVSEYVKIAGKGFDEALVDLQLFGEMLHEPERRLAKFIVSVPLSTVRNLIHNGQPISAAQRRIDILGDMRTGTPGIIHKFKLTEAQRAALWSELTYLSENYGDVFGDSPRLSKAQIDAAIKRHQAQLAANPNLALSTKKDPRLDINNSLYNALGISNNEVKLRETQFNDDAIVSPERRAAAMKVFETMQKINKATADLNKIGNYWSTPVDNLVGMYNYQHYMPFKGKAKHSEVDHSLDPNRLGNGKDLQEIEHETAGRFSIADNPVLQVLNDAFRSARRAGVRNYTQSIKNALSADPKYNPNGTGILRGNVHRNIKFEDRGVANLEEFKGGQYIFHYNEDGSIDILRVTDPKQLQALRYSFKDSNIMLQMANNVTSWIGSTHTRYNLNFAPKNFLVDALTNAWNIGGGKLGPLKSATYIKDIAYQVSKNGLGKALEVAIYHEKGDPASQKRLADMADKDPFVKAMLEMIQFGGKTTYVENFSLKNNLEKLKSLKRNRILRSKDSIEAMLDSWNGMFEFTSRTAAYMLYKESAYAKNKLTMSDVKGPNGEMSPAEQAASVEAAAETKNLANFEKAGEWAQGLGAWFMFIKPSATGAVRGIETVAPAFTVEKYAKANMPANIAADPVAAEKYMAEFKKLRTNAQLMTGTLIGIGYGLWWMSAMMAPDDEWERNSTKNDNMQQWTKYARFHIPNGVSEAMGMGKDVVFQIPWGFGLGAFASMGAQIAGMAHGNTSFKEGMGNIVLGSLADSFLPLPVSRIPITDKPHLWLLDSLLPSVIRPYFEYTWNVNGIGQTINSASQRKFGDAFTGGDRIPEAWKDLAAYAYNSTGGALNLSPNTMYFFANSYVDGFSRLGELAYSWIDIGAGEKSFNPKTDVPLLGSFFGAKSNVDARDFTAVEDKLKDFDERIKTLKVTSPKAYAEFITNNPTAETAVGIYYAQLGSLSQVREEANKIRVMPISQKDRQELLRANIFRQNIIKRQMIEVFKALGIEP
jgi:hypothetical protein